MTAPPVRDTNRYDPLLAARRVLHLKDSVLILAFAALAVAVHIGGPAAIHVDLGMPGTIVALMESAIIVPLGLVVYLWIADLIPSLFESLKTLAVEEQSRYDDFVQRFNRCLDTPLWTVIAIILVTWYWFNRPLSEVPGDIQGHVPEDQKLWLRMVLFPVYSVPLYASFWSVVRLLVVLVFTARFFGIFRLRLNPLHPDRAGGLGIVGGMLVASVLTATFVVAWLWQPHVAMRAARNKALLPWADAFQRALHQEELSEQADVATVKAGTEKLAELTRRYDLLLNVYPTWPLHAPALRGLLVTSALPLLTGIVVPVVRDAAIRFVSPR